MDENVSCNLDLQKNKKIPSLDNSSKSYLIQCTTFEWSIFGEKLEFPEKTNAAE